MTPALAPERLAMRDMGASWKPCSTTTSSMALRMASRLVGFSLDGTALLFHSAGWGALGAWIALRRLKCQSAGVVVEICCSTMMKGELNRRQFLRGVGSALAVGTAMPLGVCAQQVGSVGAKDSALCVTTTKDVAWQVQPLAAPGWRWDALNLNVDVSATAQTMEGFGACFNELGWTSLSKLSDRDRESVFRELFD